jgi:hypothetical protein
MREAGRGGLGLCYGFCFRLDIVMNAAMHIKRHMLWASLLLISAVGAIAQKIPASQTRASRLQWDAEHGVELAQNDSVRVSNILAEGERASLIRAIAAKLRPQMADLQIRSEKQLLLVAANTRIKLVDLDGDGTPEVLAQSWGSDTCGAVGNCFFWVFQKTDSGYKTILNSGAQTFTVEETRTDGFRDLMLADHDSASEKTLYLYRFSSGRYRQTGCYDADWAPNPVEPMLKKPVIAPCKR